MSSSEAASASLASTPPIAGRFRVEAQLGQGGMGSIYRVRDERTGRSLALKRMHASKSATHALMSAQFEREYHTLSQLSHPRIIEVFDYGVEDGEPFYTMELLDGQDLFQRGRMSWAQACPVLCDVASSLAILHSRRLLHRDVSARNVRLTADGRAKLIDFGAMAPMGPVKHVVGTPPFLPPEALQRQSLDARSDLYALGALAYWVLTGHYPYPARSVDQLRELWQVVPPSPKQRGVELPDALDNLVMALLQLERSGRPSSAAEVMERLSGIAGLPIAELPEVSKAYLSMPMLVGRDALLQEARGTLSAAVQGRGGAILISGDEGSGRSRLLDACLLEAKLLGATVLRADASDDAAAEFGIARELGEQLLESLPELAAQTSRLWRAELSALIPKLATPGSMIPGQQPARRSLQSALRNWFLLVARTRQLVIAVDDVDDVDEPSARLLSALALASPRRRLSVLLTHRSSERDSPRLQALRESAKTLSVTNLDAGQTEALLHSVFGDIDHVAGIAARVHGLSQGNPRWTMMLAETLVERKLARYEAGSWALPERLSGGDLPESLTSALAARIAELPADARSLAEALSLSEPALLPVDSHAQLAPGGTRAGARKALHTLIERRILAPEGAGYRFTQHELCDVLRAGLSPARATQLHERLASAAQHGADSVLIARHLLHSAQGQLAVERLLPLRNDAALSFSTRMLDVLQLAVNTAGRLQLSRLVQNELEEWLLAQAAVLGRLELFQRYAPGLLQRMERDSGLADYNAADPALPQTTRLISALHSARARHDALPAHERGLPPEDAALRLGRLCSIITAMAGVACELALVERLPSLVPFFPLHPSLRVAQAHMQTQLAAQSGRYRTSFAMTLEVIELLRRFEHEVDPLYATELRKACVYVLALMSAMTGIPGSSDWLGELEQHRGMRVLAWRVRMASEMGLGHAEAAAQCRKRAEVLLLEDAGCVPFPGTTAAIELAVFAAADDLVGTKRAMERLIPMAESFPAWRPFLELARAQYQRIQGDYQGALATLEQALPLAPPTRHGQWGRLVDLHVGLLSLLGRHEQAISHAFRYLELAKLHNLDAGALDLLSSCAHALSAAGRPSEALPLIEESLRLHTVLGTRGVFLGRVLETRARVAIALHDQAGMRQYAERCAREYKGVHNVALSAKYDALMREADNAGLVLTTGVRQAADFSEAPSSQSIVFTGSRLLSSSDALERVQEGLRLLLERTGADTGCLFGVANGTLELRAAMGNFDSHPNLLQALDAYLQQQLASQDDKTSFEADSPLASSSSPLTDSTGRRFEPMLLYGREHDQEVLTGIALLHYVDQERPAVRRDLLDAIGNALLANA